MAVLSLIFVGLLLVALGILAGGSLAIIGLGVLALVAAGIFEAMSRRSASR
jgi:hypothetical protein